MATLADHLAARPFTLSLSAGFFGFFAHAGFLAALAERGLRPKRIVGVSAGALAGGAYAAGVDPMHLRARLFALRKSDFWDPGLHVDGLLAGHRFAERLAELLGAPRPAADLPIPFASVAYDVGARRPAVLEGEVPIDVAIRASCAVPLMFRPVRFAGRTYVDGGVADRWGEAALGDARWVLVHYLPSRSPWRRIVPARRRGPPSGHRFAVVETHAPRVGPNRLDVGPAAYEAAYARARAALDAPYEPPAATARPPRAG
ncbi:MAG: patatin [Deltaproteobacteria bacterium]|nr:MAG: patatin [Deltaproteobacteria bacterium]